MKKIIFSLIIAFSGLSVSAQDQMLGEIRLFAGDYAPSGWTLCDGRLLLVDQYPDLFSLLGTTYGGNGVTTFAVPDLRGRVALGAGTGPGLPTYNTGQTGGSATIKYTNENLPAHSHAVSFNSNIDAADADTPSGTLPAVTNGNTYNPASDALMGPNSLNTTMTYTGMGETQNNMQPYLAVNYIISLYNQCYGEGFYGEVRMIAVNKNLPEGWFPCDGRLLSIDYYFALYSLIGTVFGGDGVSTFAIPDMRGRVPLSNGVSPGGTVNYVRGSYGGAESQTITVDMMAEHSHIVTGTTTMNVYSGIGDANTPVGNYPAVNPQRGYEYSTTAGSTALVSAETSETGNSQPVLNVQPYCTIQYIISADRAIYPTHP